MPPDEMLRSTAGRAAEPETKQNVQGGAENMTKYGEVVSILVAGEVAPVEDGHAADRAFCVFCVDDIG